MLFATPKATAATTAAIAAVDQLASALHDHQPPSRWEATLRRSAKGVAASRSVEIEGYHVDASTAASIVDGARPAATHDEEIVAAYGRAMDHVVAFTDDPQFKWNYRVIADLHHDLAWPHRTKRPGRLRLGAVGVTSPATGAIQYTGPDATDVPALLSEVVTWLRKGDVEQPVIVRAAMAHLHVVSIHPFEDGNGRVSRVLQSLVLALGGKVVPELASIEEYLARDTAAYYDALHQAQGGRYDPSRSAAGWVEFCAHAHEDTAKRRVRQLSDAAARWSRLEALIESRGWADRLVIALEQALAAPLERAAYAAEAEVSLATASADLRRLVDAGWLESAGSTRAARYHPTPALFEAIDRSG